MAEHHAQAPKAARAMPGWMISQRGGLEGGGVGGGVLGTETPSRASFQGFDVILV